MTRPLEDQIRSYTDALYATASTVEDLMSGYGLGETADNAGVQITVNAQLRTRRRMWRGPVIAAAAALAVLVVLLPAVLFLTGGDDTTPVDSPAPTTTASTTTIPPLFDNVFLGSWIGDDPDGSVNLLVVGESSATYQETGLTACVAAFDEFAGGAVDGIPEVSGNRLTFEGTLYCSLRDGRTPHPAFTRFEWVFTYDPATDTVTLGNDPNVVLRRVD